MMLLKRFLGVYNETVFILDTINLNFLIDNIGLSLSHKKNFSFL